MSSRSGPPALNRSEIIEWLLTLVAGAAAAAWLILSAGTFGWSWDGSNHHVYLGFVAEHPRWHLDVAPASFQSYQYPYLYWPAYRMSLLHWPAVWVGALWSMFQTVMLLAPLWLISHRLLPTQGRPWWEHSAERVVACALGFMSIVLIAAIETTANDLLAAVPLLWALALSLHTSFDNRRAFWAAVLVGVALAFKLSNGLALPWLLLWWWQPVRRHWSLQRAALLALGSAAGFLAAYAPWGWQLWRISGNPFYPFFPSWFGGA